MKNDFGKWLEQEMEKREWNASILARKSGIDAGNLSRVITGVRNAGPDMCQAIAKGLGYPVDTVYRQAGLLPQAANGEEMAQLEEIARNLSPEERRELLEYALWRYRRQDD
jgi:transcriptional regulator with XRE-family HTH domain